MGTRLNAMHEDPILAEIRAIREEYARRFNYDVRAILRDLREQEKRGSRTVVTLPPRRIEAEAKQT